MMPERTLGRIRSSMQRPVVSIPAAHRLGGEPTVGYQRRMDVSTLNGKTVLVTGAASGIGRETALACARRGARMVICDVDEGGLAAIADEVRRLGCAVTARRVDVADRDAMRAFSDGVHGEVAAVDLLINNAGVAIGGEFLHTPLTDWDWIVSINVMGVVYGCHYFVPPMVARGRGGHVANVASAAGYVASQYVYFIGTNSRGLVTIYSGVPYELPAGIKLYSPYYVSGVPASAIPNERRHALLDNSVRTQGKVTQLVRSLELGQLAGQ